MIFGGKKLLSINDDAEKSAGVRRHKPDYLIILYMGLLMLLGLIIMYAIGPQRANVLNNAYGSNYGDNYFFFKQLASLLVAVVVFGFMSFLPYKAISKHAGKILILSLAACLLLAVADLAGLGIAQRSLGATRWFNFGTLGGFQPSELLKFGLLIYLASFLSVRHKQGKINDLHDTLIPVGVILALSMFFVIVLQKDMGTGIAIVAIVITMLFVAGLNKKYGFMIVAGLLAIGTILIVTSPHRIERVMTFIKGDDTSMSDDESYHVEQAKLAIGSGGLFGVGVGNSVQSTGYLPEATNDSVFAIIGETFGFVGLVAVLAIFLALLMRLLRNMDHFNDLRYRFFVAGVFGWLGAHVILNVASMIGIFPLTGITLPLLSFGGTSILFMSAALGIIFQLSHYTVYSANIKENRSNENISGWRRVGRPRHAGRGGR